MPAACLGSNRWVKAPKSLTVITRDEIGRKRSKMFIIISYHIFFLSETILTTNTLLLNRMNIERIYDS